MLQQPVSAIPLQRVLQDQLGTALNKSAAKTRRHWAILGWLHWRLDVARPSQAKPRLDRLVFVGEYCLDPSIELCV